jgi:hypothetical protein
LISSCLFQARIFKEKGTRHFKDGKLEIASTRYQKVGSLGLIFFQNNIKYFYFFYMLNEKS